MTQLRIGICGSTGRMGQEFERLAQLESDSDGAAWAIKAKISRPNPNDIPLRGIDVWIDFSNPLSTMNLLEVCGTPIVIGTTGFTDDQLERIRNFAQVNSIFMSGNMSLGITIVQKMIQHLPQSIPADVSIVEEHHRLKRDAPSGTAKMLVANLKKSGFEDVSTHSIRAGNIVGVHRIKWAALGEEIEITHRASDRQIFARGAIAAARWIVNQKPGLYSDWGGFK